MSKVAAAADRQAAEYWRQVARADRSEADMAVTNARDLSSAARREDQASQQTQTQRRTGALRLG